MGYVYNKEKLSKASIVSLIISALLATLSLINIVIILSNIYSPKTILSIFFIFEVKQTFIFYASLFMISATIATLSSVYAQKSLHYITKPLSTFILIIIASISIANTNTATSKYIAIFIIAGLSLCLVGDIFLMFIQYDISFKFGLFSFLAAHIVYGTCFVYINSKTSSSSILLLTPLLISTLVLLRLFKENLKKEWLSIVLYIIVISFMVWRSFIVAYEHFNINTILLVHVSCLQLRVHHLSPIC